MEQPPETPSTPISKSNLVDRASSASVAVWILAILMSGYVLHIAAGIFLWITASLFLVMLLEPLLLRLRRRRLPGPAASLILVTLAMLSCTFILLFLIHFSSTIVNELEDSKRILMQYYNSIVSSFNSLLGTFSNPGDPTLLRPVQKVELVETSPLGGGLGLTLVQGLGSAVALVTYAFLWPILTFFLLAERESLGRVVQKAFGEKGRGARIWRKMKVSTQAFFFGNLILGLLSFPVFFILFLTFSVKSALTLAALSSIFNLIPFLGAVMCGVLPTLSFISLGGSAGGAVALFLCCITVHFVVANFVTPKVLGSNLNINATTSTIALIVWGELWGGIGLILAIPITAIIKILFEESGRQWLVWLAEVMSERIDRNLFAPAAIVDHENGSST